MCFQLALCPNPLSSCGTNHTGIHTAPIYLTVSKLKEEQLKKNKIGNKVQHDGLCIYMSVLHIESGYAIQVLATEKCLTRVLVVTIFSVL